MTDDEKDFWDYINSLKCGKGGGEWGFEHVRSAYLTGKESARKEPNARIKELEAELKDANAVIDHYTHDAFNDAYGFSCARQHREKYPKGE